MPAEVEFPHPAGAAPDNGMVGRLATVASALSSSNDLDVILQLILTRARNFAGADAGSIWIRHGNRIQLAYVQNDTLSRGLPAGTALPLALLQVEIGRGSIAGAVALDLKSVRIGDAYAIPPSAPYRFDRSFDERSGYRTRSVMATALRGADGELLGVLQVMNALPSAAEPQRQAFSPADEHCLELFSSLASLALGRARLYRSALLRLVSAAELRDPRETGPHVMRVASYAVAIYDAWAACHGVPAEEAAVTRDRLWIAAMLHDVGKVAISDQILRKPGTLTSEEYRVVQTHTIHGAKLFVRQDSPYDEAAGIVALHHHERWDGRGYPGRIPEPTIRAFPVTALELPRSEPLRGDEIPLMARIVGLADAVDALESERAYKAGWTREAVAAELRSQAGKQFDPELVDLFLERMNYLAGVPLRYSDAAEGA